MIAASGIVAAPGSLETAEETPPKKRQGKTLATSALLLESLVETSSSGSCARGDSNPHTVKY
jgi:hypothetical protein